MLLYGNQISPLLRHIVRAGGLENINPGGGYFDRALARAMLRYWDND
jgi:hypothetical protein